MAKILGVTYRSQLFALAFTYVVLCASVHLAWLWWEETRTDSGSPRKVQSLVTMILVIVIIYFRVIVVIEVVMILMIVGNDCG